MKKTIKMLALIAMGAALTLTACTPEDNSDINPSGGNGTENPSDPRDPQDPRDPRDPVVPVNPTAGEWVDLGLPSGVLWATCNVGANNPEEGGNNYAWGETTTKSNYDWITYQHGTGYNELIKYCTNASFGLDGFTDNLTTLEPCDDAATAVLGGDARIPTQADWQELMDNTTNAWVTYNNVKGRLFTASNGNSIFIPAAGLRTRTFPVLDANVYGFYWSSSLNETIPEHAWSFTFGEDTVSLNSNPRIHGFNVRAVR